MPSLVKSSTRDVEIRTASELIACVTERLLRHMTIAPQAVILTGSFARDEGSILQFCGRAWVLGDMEFLVVVPGSVDRVRLQDELDQHSKVLARDLQEEAIDCELEFRAVSEAYFLRATPQIFTYELMVNGRRVFGDLDPLVLIPTFSGPPRWDAWRMLHNRMIEQLALSPLAACHDRRSLISALYQSVKFQLDLATVSLIFAGDYQPNYSQRADAVRRWARKAGDTAPGFLEEFADCVSSATAFKRMPNSHALGFSVVDGDLGDLQAYVEHMRSLCRYWAHEIWRWCAAELTGSKAEVDDDALQQAIFRSQPIMEKLRGWGKLMRMTTLPPKTKRWRRLARFGYLGSPRSLVYSVAARLYFSGGQQAASHSLERLGSLLPVALPGQDMNSQVQTCWRLFLRNHLA